MKKILTALVDFVRYRVRGADTIHDETLRAHQGAEQAAFGVWRALVGK